MYFSDQMTHQTIRHKVLEEENREKKIEAKNVVLLLSPALLPPLPCHPVSQGSYIQTIRCTPLSSQIWGGKCVSYTPKNMVTLRHLFLGRTQLLSRTMIF